VSGAMNMVGNLGSALSAMLFPWFVAHVTLPAVAERPGTANAFFVFAAALNLLGCGGLVADESAAPDRRRVHGPRPAPRGHFDPRDRRGRRGSHLHQSFS